MNAIAEYEVRCSFRMEGYECLNGHLVVSPISEKTLKIDLPTDIAGHVIKCPCCNGTQYVLTPAGAQLVSALWRHLEPKVVDLIEQMRPDMPSDDIL